MANKERKYYIPVKGESIEVNEEIYKAYYRPIWRTQYHARKNGECRCPKSQNWKCDGVCTGCEYYREGKKVSLDTPIDDSGDITIGDTLVDESECVEDIVVAIDLLNALYDELERLDPEGQRICELMMNHSERESAELMGMSRSTFKRHWAKLQAELKECLKDYYI